jgi:hypothetical protein
MTLKIIFTLIIFIFGVFCIVKSKKWAIQTQRFYINKSKESYPSVTKQWESPSSILLFRVMYIFWGTLLIIGAYPLVFGPISF